MNLSELIKVDSRFEKSINLSLDLEDPSKVSYYIPTRSALKILEHFLDNVTIQARNRATILVGPYGKGKSHLLLVLMALLSRSEAPEVKELIDRIGWISPETVEKIKSATKVKGKFLPVIITPSNSSLYSILLRSLQQALIREGITDVVPDSYYSEAIRTISSWEKDYPEAYSAFLDKLGSDVGEFKDTLSGNDEKALERFREIFPSITNGSVFNPVVDEDIKAVLMTVNRKLCEKHGYRGIYIIFDEFSKYIEGHVEAGFAADMGVLQDVCEVCSKSKDEQIHLTLVTHKAIRSYGDRLPKSVIYTFEAIEGRLTELYFITSSQNNYELIADALQKTNKFDNWAKKSALYKEIGDEAYRLPDFQSLFNEDEYWSIVAKGVFPLTPVGAMLLLSLSEKIAQNERTIFTYLTDEASNGLASIIAGSEDAGLVSAGSIYDYFIPLFREESDNSIHHEWLKADYAISKTEDDAEKDIVKAMSIIKMVNRPDDLPASDKIMRLACAADEDDFKAALERLVEKSLVEYKAYNNAYEFKNNIGVDVEIAISDCIEKHYAKPDCCAVMYDVMSQKYELPKKHNSERCITRYFDYKFMTQESFLALTSADYLEWDNEPDGAVLLILPEDGLNRAALKKHMKELGDRCIIIALPATDSDDYVSEVKYVLGVRYLEKDVKFLDDNPVLLKELRVLEEEHSAVINELIRDMFFKELELYGCEGKIKAGSYGINRIISDVCDSEYRSSPIFNHEMINRHNPSSQMVKARNAIIRDILEGNDLEEKYRNGSSAESTICRAVLLNTGNDKGAKAVSDEIVAFMKKSIDSRIPFSDVIGVLVKPPYGVRKGVLPILLAKHLIALGEIPVIYFNGKEVSINEKIISNIVDSPSEYFIYTEPETVAKLEYISKLERLFDEYSIYCADIDKRNRLAKLTCMMQSWYRSLPQSSVTYNDSDDKQMKDIAAFRKIFQTAYINPREIILDKLPKMMKTEDFEKTYKKVEGIKLAIDKHIHAIKEAAVNTLLETLSLDAGSDLKQSLKSWYGRLPEGTKNRIYSTTTTVFMDYVKGFDFTDPEVIIRDIAKNVTGTFIEDWNDSSMDDFRMRLETMLGEIDEKSSDASGNSYSILFETPAGEKEKKHFSYDPENISSNGSFLQNQLADLLEEYGSAVDSDEKMGILMDAIKKIMR